MEQVIYGYIAGAIGQIVLAAAAGLATAIAAPDATPHFYLPSAQEFRLQLADSGLEAVDFMAINSCSLKTTIIKSQTRIARYASDSQRLLLDLEFLRLAPTCIAQLQLDRTDTHANTLESIHAQIKQQLPARIFNATLASLHFRQVWQAENTAGRTTQTEPALHSLQAINQSVMSWLSGDYRADNLQFEIQLSEVAKVRLNNSRPNPHLAAVLRLEARLRSASSAAYLRWQQRR